MGAALGLGGFALFGWLTGLVFRRLLRGRRFGYWRIALLLILLEALAIFGFMLSVAVFTVGPDDIPSDVERAVLKIAAWPVFAVVAVWAYRRNVRTRILSQRIVGTPGVVLVPLIADVRSTHADGPPLPAPPPAPLPQPF